MWLFILFVATTSCRRREAPPFRNILADGVCMTESDANTAHMMYTTRMRQHSGQEDRVGSTLLSPCLNTASIRWRSMRRKKKLPRPIHMCRSWVGSRRGNSDLQLQFPEAMTVGFAPERWSSASFFFLLVFSPPMEPDLSPEQMSGPPPPPPATTTWNQSSSWQWPPGPVPAAMTGPPMSGPPPTWPPPIQDPTATTHPPPHAPQLLQALSSSTPPSLLPPSSIPPRPTQSEPDTSPPLPPATMRSLQPPPAAAPPRLPPAPAPAPLPPNTAAAPAATRTPNQGRGVAGKSAGKKRKRKNKPKGERLNRKNWADGVRAEFMKPYVPRYVDAVAKGGWAAGQEVIRQLCAEYHARIPWTLHYSQEPTLPLPDYDPNNPPVLEPLSDEEEAERSAVLTELNADAHPQQMIHRWVHWRAKKVPGYRQQYRANRNNPWDRLVLELSGMNPKGTKKALQAVQQYAHEHPDASDEAGRAFEHEKARNGIVKNRDRLIIKQSVNWTMDYIKKHYFDKLPASERAEYGARARETARQEKEAWERALKEPPRQDAKSIQTAWDSLDAFVEPLLSGIVTRMDASVVLFIGARLPEEGGRPNSRHFVMGKNREGLPFSLWNESHFQKDVLGSFLEYIETVWSPEECAAVDLNSVDSQKSASRGVGGLGRTDFTAQEMEDEDEEEDEGGVEDDDDDEDEVEVPLASSMGGPSGSGGARKRQKKSNTTPSTTTSLDRTPTPAIEQTAPAPRAHEDLDPHLIGRLDPRLTALSTTPTLDRIPTPASEQSAPASRAPHGPDPQPIGQVNPQLIEQANPEPIQPEQPAQTLRRSGRSSALQREREQAGSLATSPAQENVQPTEATTAVNSSGSRDALGLPSASPRANTLSPGPHTDTQPSAQGSRAPSSTAPPTAELVRQPLRLPESAEGNAAAQWFRDAWKYVAHDFGPDWMALISDYGSWEEAHAYTSAKGASKALPTLNTRPKEVAVWISHARWARGRSGEPNPKDTAFAHGLLRRWWEWYRRLSPSWRRTQTDGTLEPCTVLGDDMGKLECSGVNGVLNLVVVLKWVKEGLSCSENSVDKDPRLPALQDKWAVAVRDLQIMLHAMVEKKLPPFFHSLAMSARSRKSGSQGKKNKAGPELFTSSYMRAPRIATPTASTSNFRISRGVEFSTDDRQHARRTDVLVPVAQRRRVHEAGDDVETWPPYAVGWV
ncbi:hypothetical protein EV121DRAFT_273609 [Schizophyllum commune]